MHVPTYEQIALAWQPDGRQDRAFRLWLLFVVAIFLFIGIVLSSLRLPEKPRPTHIQVPERVAKYITQRPKPKQIEPPKPVHKPLPKPEPRFERKPREPEKTLTKLEQAARKTAEESGLLALTKDLSDLMDTSNVDAQVSGRLIRPANAQVAADVDTNILADSARRGSGGSDRQHSGAVGRSTLDEGQRKVAQQLLASKGEIATVSNNKNASPADGAGRGEHLRSEADVAYVMDKHKSILHSIYRRARRSNPGLQGKIVLEITILPTGQVANVRVKSSELNDASLESSLIARIKQFDFGSKQVETLTVVVPVEFLPS